MVVGKRLCLIILILSDVDSLFLVSLPDMLFGGHALQKDVCHHTELHRLHTLCSTDIRLAFVNDWQAMPALLD